MTKNEFIEEFVLRHKDVDAAIEVANQLEEVEDFSFDISDEYRRLEIALSRSFDHAQLQGGFCIQFNQERPLLAKITEKVDIDARLDKNYFED